MKEEDIQEILQTLGERVSSLAEENRVRLTRDDAGRHLIKLMSEFISPNEWLNIYQNTDDIFSRRAKANATNPAAPPVATKLSPRRSIPASSAIDSISSAASSENT